MSAPENVSYFGRFFLKFIEIIAAGLATAVSGYLIAHLSGVLPSAGPAPAAPVTQATPNVGTVASVPAQAGPGSAAPASQATPSVSNISSVPAQPGVADAGTSATAISVDSGDRRLATPKEPNSSPIAQPARRAVTVAKPDAKPDAKLDAKPDAKPEPARKRVDNAPDQGFASQVRAALTNVDANRADPLEVPARQPADVKSSVVGPGAASPRQQSPFESNQAAPVEIQSRPVADPQFAPPPAAPDKDAGLLSALEQMLRQDPLAGATEAPRPPLPVGQQ
jgi:hypothetical protein